MIIDSERFLSAKNWILSMTDDEDNETGDQFWLWMENNNELSKNDSNNLLNTFFLFFHDNPNVVVATGSIVADDQDMGKKLNLKDALWIGGVNVHRDFRGKSIGKILIGYIDNYIKQFINKDTTIYLFTNNIQAKNIYKQYHFQSKGFIQNNSIKQNDQTVKNIKLNFKNERRDFFVKQAISNELFVKFYPSQINEK
jgi:predicted GNAT family N-acyltransferase